MGLEALGEQVPPDQMEIVCGMDQELVMEKMVMKEEMEENKIQGNRNNKTKTQQDFSLIH